MADGFFNIVTFVPGSPNAVHSAVPRVLAFPRKRDATFNVNPNRFANRRPRQARSFPCSDFELGNAGVTSLRHRYLDFLGADDFRCAFVPAKEKVQGIKAVHFSVPRIGTAALYRIAEHGEPKASVVDFDSEFVISPLFTVEQMHPKIEQPRNPDE